MRNLILAILALAALSGSAIQTDPIWPPPDTTNAPSTAGLEVLVSDNTNDAVVTFMYRKAPPPVRTNFTIVAMPDTQNYCAARIGGLPEMFYSQTDWIRTNRESHNIVFACQLGDCVHNLDIFESEWIVATNALYRLEDPESTKLEFGLPYAIAPGNHDGPPHRFYNKYFGVSHFQNKPYYGGHGTNGNNNSFVLFSTAGMDFIAVMLEFAPGPEALAWANDVLKAYADRRAIIVSHSILRPGVSEPTFNAQGQPIYDALKENTNVFLMMCGHDPQHGRRFDTYNGNTIISILSDYESETNGGNGWMRTMEFVPDSNRIDVKTYSPWLNEFKTTVYHQFSLNYNMSVDGRGYAAAGNFRTNASRFVSRSQVLSNLVPGVTYEWFVTIDQGETNTIKSKVWRFTTAPTAPSVPTFKLLNISNNQLGHATITWNSVGGSRYRIQYSDALPEGGFSGAFTDILRPSSEEIDAGEPGVYSVQIFTDDFSYTGGPPANGARFYRILKVE